PMVDPLAMIEGGAKKDKAHPVHYADAAVLAYPALRVAAGPVPSAAAGTGEALDGALLADASLTSAVEVKAGGRAHEIVLHYPAPRTVRSATIFVPGALPPFGDPAITPVLEVRDGAAWRKLADFRLTDVPTTVAFAPASASEFRVVFGPYTGERRPRLGDPAPGAAGGLPFPVADPQAPITVADLRLHEDARVDRFETKAGFAVSRDYYALSRDAPEATGIDPQRVIDLTGRLRADGTLDWSPPKGTWTVVRLGYSLTGKTNHPATAEATGLEVDKLDAAAVRRYLDTYLGMYRDAAGPDLVGAKGVRALLTDSTEVGAFNWTPRLVEQFKRLRGYDPTPWLPALTGTIVGSRSRSDAFLYDFRRTLADLHASEHYGTIAAFARANGLKVYGEALEDVRPSLGDDMAMRRYADVPMAALWTWNRGGAPRQTLLGDMKGASSVAHVYGQNLAAAESMTSALTPWAHAPADLRPIVDLEFAYGINRPVIHTSVHQPVDDKQPGLSLMIFGQYFNRHETWAEMARPWIDYIARTSFMLQQGRDVADVAYFYGEEQPLTALFAQAPPADLPVRYAYDFVNADVLRDVLTVENGQLAAPSGARYRVLYLGGTSQRMTLPVLRRIADLAAAGATVVGRAPTGSPGLDDDPAEFASLVGRLWSGTPTTAVGKGRVIASGDVEVALAGGGTAPDFDYAKPQPDSEALFVHRRTSDADIYFVNNRRNRAERLEARFRLTGKAPEIWRADSGQAEPVSYRTDGQHTVVPLDLAAEESVFVVFRRPAPGDAVTVAKAEPAVLAALDGPWRVAFQPGRGAPPAIELPRLASLSDHGDAGIRYFSGVATYSRAFTVPSRLPGSAPLWLGLGAVGDVAEVRVNGTPVGTAWHAPYRLDIAGAVKPGRNTIEVRVANLWVNRLVGDAQPGAARIAFTASPTYRPDAPLRPSGLIGPVRLLTAATE
ncbi:MAG: glycosyl hydrolase, partial [Novosphingobium sp.]